MRDTSAPQQAFTYLVDQVGKAVAAEGFARKETTLRKWADGNAAIINFQRSRSNTADRLSFTINLSIVCGLLLDPQSGSIKTVKEHDGHLRRRIGWLMPERQDKWWEIDSATKIDVLSAEIAGLLLQEAVPYLSRYLPTEKLMALWESGMGPGLTEMQCAEYLAKLKNAKP